MAKQPRVGDLARCSHGCLGRITNRRTVTYPDGTSALAWVGYHMEGEKKGQPWSSRNPKVIERG